MASALRRDGHGRTVVVVTSPDTGQMVGEVVGVLVGNDLRCNQVGVYWLGKTGRAPTPQEMRGADAVQGAPLRTAGTDGADRRGD